jgi:simple sugar transport system ATP-binding protein
MQIELQDIHKYYGPVKANNGINLKVTPGQIHGILGENGAGKSTLMKILAGFSQQTRGSILVEGSAVDYRRITAVRPRLRSWASACCIRIHWISPY